MFSVLQLSTLNSYIFFKNYITNQNQKCKGWAFRDFIFDCVQKKTEQEGREDDEVSADVESVDSTFRASTA